MKLKLKVDNEGLLQASHQSELLFQDLTSAAMNKQLVEKGPEHLDKRDAQFSNNALPYSLAWK
jgi:hypothetical protein